MRLSRQKAFLLVLISSLACHTTTEVVTSPAYFNLRSISDRPLPTFVSPVPETPNIISASLFLDGKGKAVMTENRQDMFHVVTTYTSTFDYRIDGNQIEIGSFQPCPINAICAANLIGTISPGGLSLIINPFIVYQYQRLLPD